MGVKQIKNKKSKKAEIKPVNNLFFPDAVANKKDGGEKALSKDLLNDLWSPSPGVRRY